MYQTQIPSPHIWLTAAHSNITLVQQCRAAGVDVVPADVFATKNTTINAVRISLTAADSAQTLSVALQRIADTLGHFDHATTP